VTSACGNGGQSTSVSYTVRTAVKPVIREPSSGPLSYESQLRLLLCGVFESDPIGASRGAVTLCAPRWVVDRLSEEVCRPVEVKRGVPFVATDELVVTALPALEQRDGLGFLAAVDAIAGRCVEITACHADVAPDRWPDLTLALAHGLGPAASVAIEQLGT